MPAPPFLEKIMLWLLRMLAFCLALPVLSGPLAAVEVTLANRTRSAWSLKLPPAVPPVLACVPDEVLGPGESVLLELAGPGILQFVVLEQGGSGRGEFRMTHAAPEGDAPASLKVEVLEDLRQPHGARLLSPASLALVMLEPEVLPEGKQEASPEPGPEAGPEEAKAPDRPEPLEDGRGRRLRGPSSRAGGGGVPPQARPPLLLKPGPLRGAEPLDRYRGLLSYLKADLEKERARALKAETLARARVGQTRDSTVLKAEAQIHWGWLNVHRREEVYCRTQAEAMKAKVAFLARKRPATAAAEWASSIAWNRIRKSAEALDLEVDGLARAARLQGTQAGVRQLTARAMVLTTLASSAVAECRQRRQTLTLATKDQTAAVRDALAEAARVTGEDAGRTFDVARRAYLEALRQVGWLPPGVATAGRFLSDLAALELVQAALERDRPQWGEPGPAAPVEGVPAG